MTRTILEEAQKLCKDIDDLTRVLRRLRDYDEQSKDAVSILVHRPKTDFTEASCELDVRDVILLVAMLERTLAEKITEFERL